MGLRGFPFSTYFLRLQVFSILVVILAVLSEVCQTQHTFVLESVQQLNFRNASLLVSGYTLSDFSITTYPLDEVYQFRYFTVDQDRHISAQLTTRFGDKIYKWTVAESYSSPLICDQKSNVVQIINVPNTNYFYGINAQLVTGSNCSSALLLWDILPSPLGPITEQSFALPNLPATASMTHATFSGSSFLVLSSFNVFNVALKTMGYISGPQTYIFTHLCADWDNSFPVWGIDISAATIRLFNTPTPGATFTQITVSNMPAVNLGIPVGAKKLSGVSDTR